jgi:hypothetical protein
VGVSRELKRVSLMKCVMKGGRTREALRVDCP